MHTTGATILESLIATDNSQFNARFGRESELDFKKSFCHDNFIVSLPRWLLDLCADGMKTEHLPNASQAQVTRKKVVDYLLCAEHPDGGSKAYWRPVKFKVVIY